VTLRALEPKTDQCDVTVTQQIATNLIARFLYNQQLTRQR